MENCFSTFSKKLNIDSLGDIEEGVGRDKDSRILMKQIFQMKGLMKCVTLVLLIMSIIYLVTRVQSYYDLMTFKDKDINPYRFENM